MTGTTTLTRERTDLIESLRRHRSFLRFTVRDLTDEQAQRRPTASALNLAGLVKHVAATEAGWVRFAEGGAEAMNRNWGPDVYTRHWHLQSGEVERAGGRPQHRLLVGQVADGEPQEGPVPPQRLDQVRPLAREGGRTGHEIPFRRPPVGRCRR